MKKDRMNLLDYIHLLNNNIYDFTEMGNLNYSSELITLVYSNILSSSDFLEESFDFLVKYGNMINLEEINTFDKDIVTIITLFKNGMIYSDYEKQILKLFYKFNINFESKNMKHFKILVNLYEKLLSNKMIEEDLFNENVPDYVIKYLVINNPNILTETTYLSNKFYDFYLNNYNEFFNLFHNIIEEIRTDWFADYFPKGINAYSDDFNDDYGVDKIVEDILMVAYN